MTTITVWSLGFACTTAPAVLPTIAFASSVKILTCKKRQSYILKFSSMLVPIFISKTTMKQKHSNPPVISTFKAVQDQGLLKNKNENHYWEFTSSHRNSLNQFDNL